MAQWWKERTDPSKLSLTLHVCCDTHILIHKQGAAVRHTA